jgi:hypothetical protein
VSAFDAFSILLSDKSRGDAFIIKWRLTSTMRSAPKTSVGFLTASGQSNSVQPNRFWPVAPLDYRERESVFRFSLHGCVG